MTSRKSRHSKSKPKSVQVGKYAYRSMLSSKVFKGKCAVNVNEVAMALCVTRQHIMNLIDEGKLPAIDLSGPPASDRLGNNSYTPRRTIRIACSAYDHYIRRHFKTE